MGTERPKRLPRPSVDRPRIQSRLPGLKGDRGFAVDGVTVAGTQPRVIMLVDTSTNAKRRAFKNACIKAGVHTEMVHAHGDARYAPHPTKEDASVEVGQEKHAHQTSFDCWGTGQSLATIIDGFAVSWHYAVSVRVGVVAGGNGEEKPRRFDKEQEQLFQTTKERIEPMLAPIGHFVPIHATAKKSGCVGDATAELPMANVDADSREIAGKGFVGPETCGPPVPSPAPTVRPMFAKTLSVSGQKPGEVEYVRDANGCLQMQFRECPV